MDKKPKMTKEEKRAMLKAKLREKIRGKSSNRLGKNHKNSQYNKAQEALKTMVSSMQQDSESAGASQININDMLKSVIPDAKSRKINKKCWTVIENFDWLDLNIKKTLKIFKKVLKCNGNSSKNKNDNLIIQLQGNHVEDIKEYFIFKYELNNENFIIKGL